MDAARLDLALIAQARTLIARLEMVSHGRTAVLGPSGGDGEPLYPPGGISRKDDREPLNTHKSHLHYQARLRGCLTDHDLEQVIAEAEATLHAWQHSPRPPVDSPAWQQKLAEETGKAADVARAWNVKKEYVWMLRRRYGTNIDRSQAA